MPKIFEKLIEPKLFHIFCNIIINEQHSGSINQLVLICKYMLRIRYCKKKGQIDAILILVKHFIRLTISCC
jgi:hypothetical protein